MFITKLGYHYVHENTFSINRPNGSGDYLLLLFLSTAIIELNNEKKYVKPGSLIIYKKGSAQTYCGYEQPFKNDFIHFDFSSETELSYLSSAVEFDTLYEISNIELLSKLILEISMEDLSNNPKKAESMILLLKLLFIKIEEQLTLTTEKASYSIYYRDLITIRSNIYNDVGKKHRVEDLANLLGLSPSYFQVLYKKTFGISCIQDVIQSKIEYAKYSLSHTSYQVKEIASLCGYDNDVHFMRQFKTLTGYTPKEYRNKFPNQ